jgi:hypothetical protein
MGVNSWRQRERGPNQAVLKFGNHLCLPVQPLNLPGAQAEGDDGDQSYVQRIVVSAASMR